VKIVTEKGIITAVAFASKVLAGDMVARLRRSLRLEILMSGSRKQPLTGARGHLDWGFIAVGREFGRATAWPSSPPCVGFEFKTKPVQAPGAYIPQQPIRRDPAIWRRSPTDQATIGFTHSGCLLMFTDTWTLFRQIPI
jgi:hypothetical protein